MSTTVTPGPNGAEWARLADLELVELFVELIKEVDDDRVMDAMYFALDELLERFAPPIAAITRFRSINDSVDDPAARARELEHSLRYLGQRHEIRMAARIDHSRKREGDDA